MFRLQLSASPILSPAQINALYQKANAYFNSSHPSAATDARALILFAEIIRSLEGADAAGAENQRDKPYPCEDILLQSYLKEGVLLDVKADYAEALGAYAGALRCLRRHPERSDSLFFKVYIYAGPDYYQLENFDSAYYMLNKAEQLADRYPGLGEKDRLYNALGALYYESGNYLLGKNYFIRALEIIRRERPADKISAMNFENNIAGCYYKLGAYRQSLEIYHHLLLSGQSSNLLRLNMGKCLIGLADYSQALDLFRKIDPTDIPGVYNEMASVLLLQGKKDSALYFLDRWRYGLKGEQQIRIDSGINYFYRAQVLISLLQRQKALDFLQQAIITFSGTFKDPAIDANPTRFAGSFASYRLFDALSYKAAVLKALYGENGRPEYLLEALHTYNSAIVLFRFIEKTYTTDDAKLFLQKNNRDLYENAVLACLALDRLHPGGPYLEQAFILSEKSKASILSGSLDELAYGKIPGMDPQLVQKQQALKYKIARLELKSDPEKTNAHTGAMADEKAGYEIELSFLQKEMERNSGYYKAKFGDVCPTVRELQERCDPDQAIVSLFLSSEGLHVFTLSSSSFHYRKIDSVTTLKEQVKRWIDLLNNTEKGRRFGNKELEAALSRRLVRPLIEATEGLPEWTLIPDGIFCQLPFESLPLDTQHHSLIETTTVSYQPSTKFLVAPFQRSRKKGMRYSVLSFAPFSGKSETVSTLSDPEPLPGSGLEIAGLPGKQFLNGQATKQRFLEESRHYPVIHLATHARADAQNSRQSLICFYPKTGVPEEDNLYLPELYGLKLDSTELVILSACESGKGEIAGNEGVISLSRGFMYAGCGSTVNSLWKADDESTAFILRQFHVYLEEGWTKSAALRKAKLDYIHGNALYITPNYWAHLILIGNKEAIMQKSWKKMGFAILAGLVVGLSFFAGLFILRGGSAYRGRSSF